MAKRSVIADRIHFETTGALPVGADAKAVENLDPRNLRKASYNLLGSRNGWIKMTTLQLKRMSERYGVPWPVPHYGKLDKQQKGELIQACYAVRQARSRDKLYGNGASFKMAARIFEKFGGIWGVVTALENLYTYSGDERDKEYARSYNTVRHWRRSRAQGGRDGIIPPQLWQAIMRAARYQGIVLTAEDFLPELFDGSVTTPPPTRPRGNTIPSAERFKKKGEQHP